MATLWVGSRKGLFRYDHGPQGWQVAGPPAFLAGPVSMLLDDPRDGTLYVALNHGHFGCKLHRSDDRGASWTELAAPAYPASDAPDAPALELIWELVPAGDDQPGALWLGTIPGGLFRSDDRGDSWQLNQPLWDAPGRDKWMGGGYDHAGIHSILVDPRDSRHVVIGVSTGGVWITEDGGQSWRLAGQGMRADYMPPEMASDPISQDVHRLAPAAPTPTASGASTIVRSLSVMMAAKPFGKVKAWCRPRSGSGWPHIRPTATGPGSCRGSRMSCVCPRTGGWW